MGCQLYGSLNLAIYCPSSVYLWFPITNMIVDLFGFHLSSYHTLHSTFIVATGLICIIQLLDYLWFPFNWEDFQFHFQFLAFHYFVVILPCLLHPLCLQSWSWSSIGFIWTKCVIFSHSFSILSICIFPLEFDFDFSQRIIAYFI